MNQERIVELLEHLISALDKNTKATNKQADAIAETERKVEARTLAFMSPQQRARFLNANPN